MLHFICEMKYHNCRNSRKELCGSSSSYILFWIILIISLSHSTILVKSTSQNKTLSSSNADFLNAVITTTTATALTATTNSHNNNNNKNDAYTLSLPTFSTSSSSLSSSIIKSYKFEFKHSLYNVTIPENSVGKSYAIQPPNDDRLGINIIPNLDVKYRIISGDRDKLFKTEERIIGDFAFLAIRTRTGNIILNREKTDEYRLGIKATGSLLLNDNDDKIELYGNGGTKHVYECETEILIKVLDRNDLSPLFYPTEYTKVIPEDMPLHKSILKVIAEDADLGINGEIYYSFLDDTDYFAIHPTTGIVSLTRSLNYVEKSLHQLLVIATDRGSGNNYNRPVQASKARVTIKVEPTNLYPPNIYVQTLPEILENSRGYIYGIVRVTDKDDGIHGQIKSLEIVGGDPDGHFRIIKTDKLGEYNIEIHRLLDREQSPNGYNLTLRAVDCGKPPQSSYKMITVNLIDVNDNAPVFNRETYEVSVPETSPINTPVMRLKVTDRDQGNNARVFLELVGGNEGGEFRINPDTGMLYTQKLLDAEIKTFYTLTVSAIDQGNSGTRKQSSAKVKINVQDANDNDPIFEENSKTIWVDENEPVGTVVTKVTARDRDSGENAYISYSIANLNDVPFDIDHFSGTVKTSKIIDYESMRREYTLAIRASDWGIPYRRQTEMELIIKIKDVNDNRPQFERIDCVGYIPRQISIGTEILTLSAIDYDIGNYISYRLVSGNEDGCFNLDMTSGVISTGCDLTDIRQEHRQLNVTATDGTHFADTMTIHIHLIELKHQISTEIMGGETAVRRRMYSTEDNGSFECRDTGVARKQIEILAIAEKNNVLGKKHNGYDDFAMMPSRYGENAHSPEFVDFPIEIKVNETVKLGETIILIKARDRDLGYNGKLVFGISDGDHDSVFRLDPDTGELQIIGYLDRERQDEYILNITVYDLGKPQKSASKMLPITILDENDNPPKFEKSVANFRVVENAINGTILCRLTATDADLGENAKISYSMITDTKDFAVDQNTGVLYVNNNLDREKIEVYELRIRATDLAGVTDKARKKLALHSDAVVRVIVDDVNDNPPEFITQDSTFRVREDIPRGTVIAILNAIDLDLGPGGEVLYSLTEDGVDDDVLFKIDKYSGTIRTEGFLDYEEQQIHSLKVRAHDRGTPVLSSETTVIIEIIDVNENRYAPQFEDFVFTGSVYENKPIGTHVMQVTATDDDPVGPDSRISYSIKGGDGLGVFNLDSEGSIRTMAVLDIESKKHYWLTVCAQDQSVMPLQSCVQVFIQVLNENDNIPLTEKPVYYPSISEGSPAGEEILQVVARDGDIDPFQHITYRIISGNPEGFFAINSTTGIITTTARKLDRENQSEHILEIAVADNGIPQLSSTTRIVISVDDINDHSPEFDQRFYKVQIPATAKLNQPLFQVLAIDNDIGENGRVSYIIKSGKGKAKFRINSDTGVIYSAKPFEPDAEFDLAIRAEDNGTPKRSHTTRVNVVVVRIPEKSEHPPVIKSLNQKVEVTESDRPGFLVTLIHAIDEDDDQLWYDIIDGDSKNEFYIGRDNGNILLAKSLDWEIQKFYNLTISVTDGVHIAKTQLYVKVIDINDHSPEFGQLVYHVNVSENIEENTEILQLNATDLDEDKKIFYTLHAARDPISLSLFRIDSITGSIVVTQRLDRELITEHVLIVIAKDQGTPAKRNYTKILITVNDHNDHAPEFTSKIIQGKVYETATIGTRVLQMYALDRDIGENAKIMYSIVGGNIGNVFDIDPIFGDIFVVKQLDISSIPEYMLQIKATDNGNPSLASQIPVHITVTMADNDPPRFIKSITEQSTGTQQSAEIFENLPIGKYVAKIEARSTSSVFYDIISGNTDDMFQINPSSGVITTKDTLDYEKNKYFNLTISATNMASASSVCSIEIHILDQNDNAPYFLKNIYRGEISETAPIASLVLSTDDPTTLSSNLDSQLFENNSSSLLALTNTKNPLIIKAFDADSGLNAILHYDIFENYAKRYFQIDSITGAITTLMLLDHEKIDQFNFTVKINDSGKPKLSSETVAKIQINVLDVNDCPPVFDKSEYNVTLLLPTYENVVVIQVKATDPDGKMKNSTLHYEIIEGNVAGVFAIDSKTGVITTRDVEKIGPSYKLNIQASDGKYSTITHVNIAVETSDNFGLTFQKSIYEGYVSENSTKITTVAVVNILGSVLNEHIEFRILNPTDMFRIGLTSGAIQTTGKSFDRETRDNYKLIVEARSQQLPDNEKPKIAHVIVNVTIIDINDNCPMFVNLPYYAVVSVDDPKGSVITKVYAVDLDSCENGEVRYEMKRGHGELFKVDRKSGEITLKQSLEGHNRDYELIIAAYDGGITPCATEVPVLVKVIDKSMPVFNKQFYSIIINENIEVYSSLSTAIQASSPLGRKLIYTIVKGNDMEEFAVDFNTGVIYVADELDYEQKQSYELVIRATDSVSGVSAEVPVSILVQDVNDCPPEFEQDVYNVTVSEGSPFGTPVLKVIARDNDTKLNSQILYTIQTDVKNNSTSEYFHMDAKEGILYLKKPLDHEVQSVHYLTLFATDQGIPNLSSTAHVWVNVIDINDNPPKFEQPSYNCILSQHAERGQFVGIVTASDPDSIDSDSLLYKISEGNELQTYNIDPLSGIITLINMQNFVAENLAVILNISVTDGLYTSFTRVKINISPENLHSPTFSHLIYDVKVNENQLPGRHVMTVTAIDKDFGEYGQITYDIVSDDMKEFFTIDKNKGVIETKISLDREERSLYEIFIIATDNGGKSGFATVKVNVGDENDNAPVFLFNEYKATINVNHPINATVLKIKAEDADDNQNSVIKYTIYDPQDSEIKHIFSINENTGILYLKSSIEQWSNKLLQFFVRANDGGIPTSLHSDIPISILIVPTDAVLPLFEKKDQKLFISELSPSGTLITRVKLAGNSNVTYRLISNNRQKDSQFSINERGELSLAVLLDREKQDMYTIGILAETETSPPYTDILEIQLHVQDENDNEPIFENQLYSLSLAENIEKGTSILKVTAKDADSGANGEVRYYLSEDIDDIANIFDIDMYTGWITTLLPLDREDCSEYRFQVIGYDHGQPRHIVKTTVIIKLKDYNDNPLIFKKSSYSTSVSEDALPGTVLLQVSVSDRDVDIINTSIEFYVISGDTYSQFQIRQTGELFVSKPLDREMKSFYELKIIATDGKFTTQSNISITVTDVNDNPPYCYKFCYRIKINESIIPNTQILHVLATDADKNSNSKLRFYLTGNGSDDFILDKDNGILRTARQLDREIKSHYSLTAYVQDRDHLSWECSSKIEIIITDINDNPPEFTVNLYTAALPEDAEIGTVITKVHATDKDIGLNRRIRYALIGNSDDDNGNDSSDYFDIASDSGIITLRKTLDRETISTHNLSVIAVDQGSVKLTSSAQLIVNVQDVNDNPPEFSKNNYFVLIPEISPINSEVIKLEAISRDIGINAEIYYSIISGNDLQKFTINRNSGIVTINGDLDYEKTKEYFLTIQAVDGGTPSLSNLATLNITITDNNDNSPQFIQNSYQARIREDAMIGEKILQVRAYDIDSDDNGHVTYNIERGDRLGQFHIDEDTGYISVADNLDRESISNYVIEVQAKDNGIPQLSNYVHVNIEISDANDNPPLFNKSNYTVMVQEDKELGHVILKFDITDADTNPNAAPYTFDFRSGNDGGVFRLEQDGTLRTAARFNYKIRSNYDLQIRVFDNGTPPLYSDAWVHVNVIEESRYPPVITPLEIFINSYQDEFPGGNIGRIFATDQDQYDVLTYNLEPSTTTATAKATITTGEILDTPSRYFNISKEDGTLYALSNLDVGDYKINVSVTDGKFITFAIIKISVDLITPKMLSHSVIIRFRKITAEDFILSHRKGFIRSIRTAMRCRQKDVIIITVQNSDFDRDINKKTTNISTTASTLSSLTKNKRQINKSDLDVVFTVRKQQINPLTEDYFSVKEITSAVMDNLEDIEEMTNLQIEEILKTKCNQRQCLHGICKDKILFNKDSVNTIATDVTSFISLSYKYVDECECKIGFGGARCDMEINRCAKDPCPSYKRCIPIADNNEGFRCVCPDGFAGQTCDRDIKKCGGEICYQPINPVSFSGKSYVQYKIDNTLKAKKALEVQLIFTLRVRTVQQTGTLMYAAGKVDYNILEIVNGVVQYRFDLGSGEGLISVTSIYVSDGEWHEIKLERERNSARLIINGKHVAQGNAPGVNEILNLQSNDLYLGAEVQPHPSILGFEEIQKGFIGCMDDIQLSKETVPFQMSGTGTTVVLKRFANVEFTCDPKVVLVPLGICGMQPCLNGGICKDVGYGNFECQCHPRFTGSNCKDDLDPCASSPCLFGGKCKSEGYGNYSCECPLGMTGKRCQFGRFCFPNPCRNGGVCEEGDSGPLCMCRGYKGFTCETDIDECENQPCGNGATCINEAGSFRCICPPDLTGASCGDPLYSNSITTKFRNLSIEHMIGIVSGTVALLFIVFITICCIVCSRRSSNHHTNNINNDPRKDITLNSASGREEYKRGSKLSNLEIIQRPLSYTSSSNNETPYSCNTIFVNNLDTLRSYGSTGDDLENVPPEYQKLNCNNQQININAGNCSNDHDMILNKQTWSDQMHLKTFTDNKLNNERKKVDHQNSGRLATLKTSGIIQGRLLNVPLPNPSTSSSGCNLGGVGFDDSPGIHGQYHWDCSDWARRSHNPLPDITEVPGSEIPDSSSFHSNESNESHLKIGNIQQERQINEAQKQNISLDNIKPMDTIERYDYEKCSNSKNNNNNSSNNSNKPLSSSTVVVYGQHSHSSSIPILNPLDSSSEDYGFSTVESYLRHPNTYLPHYNIPTETETDGEGMPLTGDKKLLNNLNVKSENNHDSDDNDNDDDDDDEDDDDDISAYGFPKLRNRRGILINGQGSESSSLLKSYHRQSQNSGGGSVSDLSIQLCEIEDSEDFDELIHPTTPTMITANTSSTSSSVIDGNRYPLKNTKFRMSTKTTTTLNNDNSNGSNYKDNSNMTNSVHQTDV